MSAFVGNEELEAEYWGPDTAADRRERSRHWQADRADRLRQLRSEYTFWLPMLNHSSASDRDYAARKLTLILQQAKMVQILGA